MLNTNGISQVTRTMCQTCDKLSGLAMAAATGQNVPGSMTETFEAMLFDELEHVQMLTLELTKLCMAPRMDEAEGSVFSEGELTHTKGDVTEDPALSEPETA